MKPTHVIVDTEAARAARADRQERANALLRQSEASERARFTTISTMLSWFWAMKGHMESAPAIDPGREVIQGLQVDRDERIFWVGKTWELLCDLRRRQGADRGLMLLWLHFRAPVQVGYREHEGRRVARFGLPSVAIRDLHEHDQEAISRDKTCADFWRALHLIEEMALARGWVAHRIERKRRREEVYRREPDA